MLNGIQAKKDAAFLTTEIGSIVASCSVPSLKVKESYPDSPQLYWLNFSGGGDVRALKFVVTFNNNSVLTSHEKNFNFPTGYSGSVTTPFAVPYWGEDPIIGPEKLTVFYDATQPPCSCDFEIVK